MGNLRGLAAVFVLSVSLGLGGCQAIKTFADDISKVLTGIGSLITNEEPVPPPEVSDPDGLPALR